MADIREYFGPALCEYADNVDIEFNALCYAFTQAEDRINVVFKGADADDKIHFAQVHLLACSIMDRYYKLRFNDSHDIEVFNNNHWWTSYIERVANCSTVEEYKNLK
jgi:hypothetical protein